MSKTARPTPVYRTWWFWLLALVLVYPVAGFGLFPIYLASAIPERLQQHLGWNTTIADTSFNPFTMTVGLSGVEATDSSGERVLAAGQLSLNLGLLPLLKGTVQIQQLSLDAPFLRLDHGPDRPLNLLRDWRRQHPPASSDEEGSPLHLALDRAEINGGHLQLREFAGETSQPVREYRVQPLGITLSNLATWEREDEPGEYRINAAMGEQMVDWRGTLGLAPLWTDGQIEVSNMDSGLLTALLGELLPWQLGSGRLDWRTRFQFAVDDQGMALATRDGHLQGQGLTIPDPIMTSESGDAPALVAADNLELNGVAFNLSGPELVVSRARVAGARLNAVVTDSGELNLERLLPGSDAGSDPLPVLRWSIGQAEFTGSQFQWRDERPTEAVAVTVDDLELNLGAMTEQLEEPVSYRLRGTVDQGGSLSASGQFTLQPLTFEGGINLDQVAMTPFSGYLQQARSLQVRDGTLNLAGNLDLDVQDRPMTGTFSGRGSISQFSGRLTGEESPLVSWREMRLDPIEYNFQPARLELGTVIVSEPELNLVLHPRTGHNLSRLLTSAAVGEGKGTDTPDLIFRLSQLELANAEIRYTDLTPSPDFRSRLHDLNVLVTGLSNVSPQQAQLTLKGTVDGSGQLVAEGTLATLGSDDPTTIDLSLKGMSLPRLNPYFGYYLGYPADSGSLSVDGRYQIRGSQIDADNDLVLERLELGEAVTSDPEITRPVRVGLALLRDSQGRVRLNVPVQGDLSDPQFSLGPVMMRTLRGLLVKASTSPFEMLAGVVDLLAYSPQQLGQVAFTAGETTLELGEYTKMETLARAVKARERLVLAIEGIALEAVDRPALEAMLAEQQSLPEGAMVNLASERGKTLRRLLMDEYGLAADQVVLRTPRVVTDEEATGPVVMEFELEAR